MSKTELTAQLTELRTELQGVRILRFPISECPCRSIEPILYSHGIGRGNMFALRLHPGLNN